MKNRLIIVGAIVCSVMLLVACKNTYNEDLVAGYTDIMLSQNFIIEDERSDGDVLSYTLFSNENNKDVSVEILRFKNIEMAEHAAQDMEVAFSHKALVDSSGVISEADYTRTVLEIGEDTINIIVRGNVLIYTFSTNGTENLEQMNDLLALMGYLL